jgi:predicted HD superfamily hydrolase involved in NAD metabolism
MSGDSGQVSVTEYYEYLERALSPYRFAHSVGVMGEMGKLADIYSLDRDRALVIGLLHDAGKDQSPDQLLRLADEAAIAFHYPCDRHPLYLHGPVGAYLVWRDLGVSDTVVLNTISRHTFYGGETDEIGPLQWSLHLADLLEPTRDFPGLDRMRTLAYAGELEEAAILETEWLIEWFGQHRIPEHPKLRRAYMELSLKLDVDEAFSRRE